MRQKGDGGSGFGQYLAGFLAAHDVPRKVIASEAKIHESTLSRKINEVEEFQHTEVLAIGVAIGIHVMRQGASKRA